MTNITFFWCICLININSFWNINHIIIQHLWFIHSSKKTSGWYLLPSWKTDIRLIVKLWVILNYATSHNHPQRAKTSHSKPQRATANHDNLQQAITSHEPQLPQLKRKMNKTHKKLHSLVNALSPLNHLAAAILMKIVLLLVPQVRSACRRLLISGTHTMFRHYSVCGGSIWKRLFARNITDLAVKGWKVNTKLLQNLFSVFIFSFSLLENLGRRQRQRFPYSSETFLQYFYILVRITRL